MPPTTIPAQPCSTRVVTGRDGGEGAPVALVAAMGVHRPPPVGSMALDGAPDDGAPTHCAPEGAPDGGAPDGGAPDGGVPDSGAPDGGAPDGGARDDLWGSPMTEAGRYSLSLSVTSFGVTPGAIDVFGPRESWQGAHDGATHATPREGGRDSTREGVGARQDVRPSAAVRSARKPSRRQTTAMVTSAEFRQVVAARAAGRPLSLDGVAHGRPLSSEVRRVSVLLADEELHELHRARAATLGFT